MHKRKTPQQLQAIVDAFNRDYAVGDELELRKDDGSWIVTKVDALAEVLGGHSAVAWFKGVVGAYSIDGRIRAAAGAT